MKYMLSAMQLNVMSGSVEEDGLVYAPGVCACSDYLTIADLLDMANDALDDPDASRGYLEALKDALDNANNNRNFVQLGPCYPIVFDCCEEE